MLEKLSLRNFQTHKRLELELSPGITILVGSTDAGKSAVLRALRWVCLNNPRGDAFIRFGSKWAAATLEVDGHTIKRKRGPKGNIYKLDGKVYKAMGSAVPDDIQKVLNISPASFQQQHDGPFWFMLSSFQVSRELNEIVDLSLIDRTLSNLAMKIRKAKMEASIVNSRLEKAKSTRRRLSKVPVLGSLKASLKLRKESIDENSAKTHALRVLLEREARHRATLKRLSEGLIHGKKAQKYAYRVQKGLQRVKTMRKLIEKAQKLQYNVPKTKRIQRISMQLEKQIRQKRRLQAICSEWKRVLKDRAKVHKPLRKALKRLGTLTSGRCPVCGRE